MRNLLSIGRFSQLTRISVSTLRFYADAGLLQPALIDPDSGYRYYAPEQTLLAERIAALRAVDMPLEGIAALLEASEAEAARLLEAHELRLHERFQAQRGALRTVSEMLRGKRQLPQLDVRERGWAQQTMLSVRDSATGEDFWRVSQTAYAEIQDVLRDAGQHAVGLAFELYHNKEFLGEALETEFCLPVAAALPVSKLSLSNRVRVGVHPAMRVACAVHPGDSRSFGSSYAAVQVWLEMRGLSVCGPAYTLRLASGGTEVGFPVQ